MKKCLLFAIISFLLPCIVSAGQLSDAEDSYNILFIQSYNQRATWQNKLIEGVNDGLAREGIKAKVNTEYLNADYWTFKSERVIMQRICERARQRNTDIIITSGDEAFYTLMHCGDSLPYNLPIVVSGIKYPDVELMSKLPNVCGYTSKIDFEYILESARKLFPNRTDVICVSDSSFLGLKGEAEFMRTWETYNKKHPEYTLRAMNVEAEAPTPVISSICYDYNTHSTIAIAPKWTSFISFIGKNSKAPVFSGQHLAMTNGAFGVYDVEPYESAYHAGQYAARVLQGAIPSALGVKDVSGKMLYDFKQLEFFNVSTKKVRENDQIVNSPLMERYYIWFVVLYSLIVAALIYLVLWLYYLNRRESRKRMHAQTRLLVQKRLVEQRDEFDNIFCSIHDGLITYDTEFHIHFINRSLMVMMNLDPDVYTARYYEGQMAGTVFQLFCKGEDILLPLLKQVKSERRIINIPEKTFINDIHRGVYFPVSGEIVPIYSKNKLTGMAICCRNISEEEMHKSFFNMAMDASSVFPWQYDVRTSSFHFVKALVSRIGLTNQSKTTREEFESLIYADDLELGKSYLDAILKGEETESRSNFRIRNAEGRYEWWEFRCTSYNGLTPEAPYMVLGICQSIQRYKNTEQELIDARDRAMQADTLKSAFLANMSHEIRTPLNAIVGFSDLLRDIDAFSTDEVKQFVDTININCTLLLALINDILDLSRIESGSMEFSFSGYNIAPILQQIYDSQHLNMPAGVELIMSIPEGEDKIIITDTVRLKQVINNFINNAKKFTVRGSITFGYFVEEPGYTVFFVEDTGKGISDEDKEHIFERFYKVNSFTQGAGLGLSICQTIVQRFNGKIDVISELGKGTRFSVRIPDHNE